MEDARRHPGYCRCHELRDDRGGIDQCGVSASDHIGNGARELSHCPWARDSYICELMKQYWVSLSEIIRNIGLVIGGAIGIYLAWKRVVASNKQADAQLRQAEMSRRNHVTELFNRAVGQLKDEKLEIRVGAILTLGQVCTDFRDLSSPVIRLLTTYLQQEKSDYGEIDAPADIGEIIRIIALMSQKPPEGTYE